MSTKDFKKLILDRLSIVLKQQHYKKKGNNFSYSNGDLTYFIELQSSNSSITDILKITVNTEIASSVISKFDDTSLPIEHQRHYTRRIGSYFIDEPDKWWTLDSLSSAETAANEIVDIINDKIIPHFKELQSTKDLATLWETGSYKGVTEGQRNKYLSLIDKAVKQQVCR
jgi:hypothetical protein